MQQIFSIMTVATVLATTSPGDPGNAGIAATSPVTVSACAIADLYNPALMVVFGPPITYRSLSLTFRNTDDAVATQVAFDVSHGGEHTTVVDRGRFSKGILIEHRFDDEFADGHKREPDTCTVASITFATDAAGPRRRARRQRRRRCGERFAVPIEVRLLARKHARRRKSQRAVTARAPRTNGGSVHEP